MWNHNLLGEGFNMINVLFDGQTYKELRSSGEADTWAQTYFSDILTLDQDSLAFRSLYFYTGSMSKKWNAVLRRSPSIESVDFEKYAGREFSSDGEQITKIKEVNSILRQHSMPENIVVYRYTQRQDLRQLCSVKWLKRGLCFTDKGFVSTTLVRELLLPFAKKRRHNCLLKLYLPKGLQGAYVSPPHSKTKLNEQEILLPPNTQFEIRKIHRSPFCMTIECTAKTSGMSDI